MTDLFLVSETATKLVLGHDPVPDAIGFRVQPVVKDGVIQEGKWAHTWDGTRTQHSFAPGFPRGVYKVEPLMSGGVAVWPEDPQPDPTAPPFWLMDFEGTPAWKPSDGVQAANQGTAPSTRDWFGNFTVEGVTGAKRGRFTLLGGAGTHTYERCETLEQRTLTHGTTEVFAHELEIEPGHPGGVLCQFALQGGSGLGPGGPTIAYRYQTKNGAKIVLILQSGKTQTTSPVYEFNSWADSTSPSINVQPMIPVPAADFKYGQVMQIVTKIRWALDTTGTIESWFRLKGTTAWAKTVDLPAGVAATMQHNGVWADGGRADFKNGAYSTPAPGPRSVWVDSVSISSTLEDALGYLG